MRDNYSPEGLAERLNKLCSESELTQDQIAQRVGVKRTSLHRWREGARTPSILMVARLCKLFGVSADYLLFGKDSAQ